MYYVLLALALDMRLFGAGFRDDAGGDSAESSAAGDDAAVVGVVGGDDSSRSAGTNRSTSTIASFLRSNQTADTDARLDELYEAAHRHPVLSPLLSQDSSVSSHGRLFCTCFRTLALVAHTPALSWPVCRAAWLAV